MRSPNMFEESSKDDNIGQNNYNQHYNLTQRISIFRDELSNIDYNKEQEQFQKNQDDNNTKTFKNLLNNKKSKKDIILYNPKLIVTISFPQKLEETKHNKRKYQVLVIYKDDSGKQRRRIVKFGNNKQNDVVDLRENTKVYKKKIDKLKNSDNILQSNYWRKHLLNKSNDIHNNFIDIIKKYNI